MEIASSPLPVRVAELRAWLRLPVVADEDALLEHLIAAAAENCAMFIGQTLLISEYQDDVAADGLWHQLVHRPVRAIVRVDLLDAQGIVQILPSDQYEIAIDAHHIGQIRPLYKAGMTLRIRYSAGLAQSGATLPAALRQGILRLAAHHYANRDGAEAPPAAVAALWHPFRRVQL